MRGYPIAWRSGARHYGPQLSKRTVVLLTPPTRTKTPPPSHDVRAATMRRITQIADIPPLGWSDLWLALRFFRKFTPLGRLFDLKELFEYFNRQRVQPVRGLVGNWHTCWQVEPTNPIWNGVPKGPIVYQYEGGAYGSHVPAFLAGFLHSISQTDSAFSYLPWCFIILSRGDGIAQGEVIGGLHQDVDPTPEFNPVPTIWHAPVSPRAVLWRERWADPLRFAPPIHYPGFDGEIAQPPVWNRPPVPDAVEKRDEGYDIAPSIRTYSPPVERPFATDGMPLGRVPAGKRTKEKKFKRGTLINIIASALKSTAFAHGKLADLRDLLKALHDALPKELQLKGKEAKRIGSLFRQVYKYLDKIDDEMVEVTRWKGTPWEKKVKMSRKQLAFENILNEIAEDLIGGAGDKLRGKAAAKNGWFKNKIFTSPRF